MDCPANINLPFFAYGLFKPGQLAYFQLRDLVESISEPANISGSLRLRDGLPILDAGSKDCTVKGAVLKFSPSNGAEAYRRIGAMEPDEHYRWDVGSVGGLCVNLLAGRSPRKGSAECEEPEWNGWNDPLFTAALDVVEETVKSQRFELNLKPLFRLQMAYLLLWSSIERYVSLRYHLGGKVTQKIEYLAAESAFVSALRQYVKGTREVYRADQPDEKVVLDPAQPKRAVNYYYQVRSNITHRGKGASRDYDILEGSLKELLSIFRETLQAAEQDAARIRLPVGG